MIRIRQLAVKNIGPYDNEDFDFEVKEGNPDIHILVGVNGTGKTTILHTLAASFDYFENEHKEHTSNNFPKRFKIFEEDENEIPLSYSYTILENESGIFEKVLNYGCSKCKNIHQNFHKNPFNQDFSVEDINFKIQQLL